MDIITSISTLEKLVLWIREPVEKYTVDFSGLVNLKEFGINVEGVATDAISEIRIDVSNLPKRLCTLEIIDADLFLSPNEESTASALDDLEVFVFDTHCSNLSNKAIEAVLSSSRLWKVGLRYNEPFGAELGKIRNISTLKELILSGPINNTEIKMPLLLPIYLRLLKICNFRVDKECVSEIGKLGCLESLEIKYDPPNVTINPILKLKNLRYLYVKHIHFDYKEGEFCQIRGFEKFDFYDWVVYKGGKVVDRGNKDYRNVISGMRNEAALNNWKGVVMFGNFIYRFRLNRRSVIGRVVISELVPLLQRRHG